MVLRTMSFPCERDAVMALGRYEVILNYVYSSLDNRRELWTEYFGEIIKYGGALLSLKLVGDFFDKLFVSP